MLHESAHKLAATYHQHASLKRREIRGSEGLAYHQDDSSSMGSDPEGMVHQPSGVLYKPEADNLAGIPPDDLSWDYFYTPNTRTGDSCDDTTNTNQESVIEGQNSSQHIFTGADGLFLDGSATPLNTNGLELRLPRRSKFTARGNWAREPFMSYQHPTSGPRRRHDADSTRQAKRRRTIAYPTHTWDDGSFSTS